MMTRMVAVIAKAEADRRAFARMLGTHAVETQDYESLADLRLRHGRARYVGVVVDMKALVGCSQQDKEFLVELEGSFSLLRLLRHAGTGRLSGIIGAHHADGDEVIVAFLAAIGKRGAPRGLRMGRRLPLCLSIRLPAHDAPSEFALRATSQDASERGMFVVLPEPAAGAAPARPLGGRLLLEVPELGEGGPIEGAIRWGIPWGGSLRHLPGYGVEFLRIREEQLGHLRDLLHRVPAS